MGFAKRARLNAALPDASELPPAADLSSIRIVQRDKGPAPVIALAGSRPASDDTAKSATDGMFYKKGNATAATFRPAYWTYEPSPPNAAEPSPVHAAGAVASLERQLGARRRSQPVAPEPLEEKPLASLGATSASRKPAAVHEDSAPVLNQLLPTSKPTAPPALDSRTVLELLQPNSRAAEAPDEPVLARPPEVEAVPAVSTTEVLPPPAPESIIPAPIPDLAKESPPAAAAPVAEAHDEPVPATPPEVEAAPILPTPEVLPPPVPESIIPAPIPDLAKERPPAIAAASPPAEMPEEMGLAPTAAPADASPPSVPAIEVEEIDNDAQIHGETHDARPEPPSRKRPARETARRVSTENAEVLDSLGATIESVLASRWYGSDRPSAYSGRVLRADEIAPVTPSGLIAELATVQKQETPAAAPHRGKGRIIAALCLVAIFAAAFFASLSWRSGHGLHLPTRMPAIFGALSLSDPERRTADGEAAGRQRASAAFFAT